MRVKILIVLSVLLCTTGCMVTDCIVDDVYYWPANEVRYVVDSEQEDVVEQNSKPQVIFIEDSITRNSETVVKAIIRRNVQ